jgi:hypothetical protein
MAQEKPIWEINKDAQDIVVKLVDMYPEKLGHVQPESIGCAMITNKDQPKGADWDCKLIGVTEPQSLFSSKQYILYWYKNTWEKYNKAQRVMMLMAKLLRIPQDPDGSVIKEDLKDIKCLVRKFGVDYMDSDTLPDLSEEKQLF